MSSANLQLFLEYLVEDLALRDKNFRTYTANRKEHIFTTSKARLLTQTITELKKRGIVPTSDQKLKLEMGAAKAFKAISLKIESSLKRHEKAFGLTRHRDTKITGHSIIAIYEVPETRKSDIFTKIKRTYSDALDEYFMTIHTLFLAENYKLPETRGHMWQGGHAQDQGVFEYRVSDAVSKALHDIGDANLLKFAEGSKTRVAATLRAIMSKDATNMKIFIESYKENQADQSKIMVKKNAFLKAAQVAIDRITSGKGFPYFEGSDSPIKASRKRTIKAVTDPFKKIKGVKVKTENIKPEPSGEGASLKVKQKITRRKVHTEKKERRGPRTTAKPEMSLASITADINAKLHNVVRSKMGVEGKDDTSGPLVYRSGTFARSVEVVGFAKTEKGFTNLLWNYEPNPYDIFSRGGSLYTDARDPEILIDRSIREIVAGRLGARLYTRRTFDGE